MLRVEWPFTCLFSAKNNTATTSRTCLGTSNFNFLLGSGFASDVPALSAVTPIDISSNGSPALSLALVKHLLQRTSLLILAATVEV